MPLSTSDKAYIVLTIPETEYRRIFHVGATRLRRSLAAYLDRQQDKSNVEYHVLGYANTTSTSITNGRHMIHMIHMMPVRNSRGMYSISAFTRNYCTFPHPASSPSLDGSSGFLDSNTTRYWQDYCHLHSSLAVSRCHYQHRCVGTLDRGLGQR